MNHPFQPSSLQTALLPPNSCCAQSPCGLSRAQPAPQVIRGLLDAKKYVIVVEHDLAVLDYLSDFICCLYGKPGAYGVVTLPFSVREGINIFLAGFVPTENLRFRDEALTFKARPPPHTLGTARVCVCAGSAIFLAYVRAPSFPCRLGGHQQPASAAKRMRIHASAYSYTAVRVCTALKQTQCSVTGAGVLGN